MCTLKHLNIILAISNYIDLYLILTYAALFTFNDNVTSVIWIEFW